MSTPIAVLSFDRPWYLERVLLSLKAQQGGDSLNAVHLFQDGAINAHSGLTHGDQRLIDDCVKIFREHFPWGIVHMAESNLGVALNFDRAERFVFSKLEADVAFFLEDDLELGPFYLRTLHRLANIALRTEDMSYFAAYGDHTATADAHSADPGRLIPLGHNWGFGLTRRQWLKQRPYVEQYLQIVSKRDYRDRPAEEVQALFEGWGCGCPGTSQDVAKSLASFKVGAFKINTFVPFGKYIGERGLHFVPEIYAELGYGNTSVVEADVFHGVRLADSDEKTAREIAALYSLPPPT